MSYSEVLAICFAPMAVGNEALRDVTGTAVAVNSRGKTVSIDLDAIYDAARELGPNITRAEY